MQIGDDLRTVHNAQLVYSNRQDIALTLLTGFKIWLVHNCQTEEDDLNIKIVTALLLYNACTLLNMTEICVTNNNKLKIHSKGMATFKKNKKKNFQIDLHIWMFPYEDAWRGIWSLYFLQTVSCGVLFSLLSASSPNS